MNTLMIRTTSRWLGLAVFLLLLTSEVAISQSAAVVVTPGTQVDFQGTNELVLRDCSLINDGDVFGDSTTLSFRSADQSLSLVGDGSTFFQRVDLATAGDLNLVGDLTVTDAFVFDQGNLRLAGGDLQLFTNALLIDERETARAFGSDGFLEIVGQLNEPDAFDPGNFGLDITSPINLGPIFIFRLHAGVNIAPDTSSINRVYQMANPPGGQANIRFNYFDAELNGLNENSLAVYLRRNGEDNWEELPVLDRNTTDNWVETVTETLSGEFTLAPSGRIVTVRENMRSDLIVRAYPNPVQETLWLDLSQASTEVRFRLYDAFGRLVLDRRADYASRLRIKLPVGLPAGFYSLAVTQADLGTQVIPLTKQ